MGTMRKKRLTRTLISLVLLAGFPPAHGAHPLITEDAATQGADSVQLELSFESSRDEEEQVRTRARQLGALLAIGLTDALDLVLGQPRLRIAREGADASTTAEGAGDFSMDLKWRFYRKGSASLALKPGLTLPTGDDTQNLGNGKATYALFLVGSFAGHPWTVHTHVGYKANRNRLGQPVDVVHLSAAAVYEASERVKLVADAALDSDFRLSTGSQPAWLVLGAICSLGRDLDLDLGLKAGLNRPAPDIAALVGLAARW